MKLVKIEDASFKYGDEFIFENINLDLSKGEVLCLFGPNGCGKTTLLDCILGIKKLNSGLITIENTNIKKIGVQDLAKLVSYVPQIHNKSFPYKVIDIVLMGRAPYQSIFSSPRSEDMEIAEQALELLGIKDFKDKVYTQLSGGETQLVMMARAIAQETPIIIMDEPTAHLDFKNELKILEAISGFVKKKEISIIMATHFPNHAFYFENSGIDTKVALMNNKVIATLGKPSWVLTENNMKKVFQINSKVFSIDEGDGDKINFIVPLNSNIK
ncbi:ABC transporter ATP-binding protein [Clostridium sp. DL1XJH146]